MKIVNIVPGFGGTFYCGNCLRDSVFGSTLKAMGHESIMIPLYLPLANIEARSTKHEAPIFYGAVNIYLKQNISFLRKMPSWLEQILNSKPILKYAASKAGSTRAEGLEEMTLSMLRGKDGFQKEELNELTEFLKTHIKPDIVHLSNALLLGLAEEIHTKLSVPVVCSLQDEDVWVDAMKEEYREKVWQLMSEKAKYVDAFIPVSHYFAEIMKTKMNIPDNKMHIVYIGVDLENYKVRSKKYDVGILTSYFIPQIGFLSRMCEENGLEILVDAFIELKDSSAFKNVKLKLYGGMTNDDKSFIKRQIDKLKIKGYLNDVELTEEFSQENLSAFFNDLTVLSVPVLKGEAFGLYMLESLASGVPIVQPALGAFPEIIETTGGGITYSPNDSHNLASAFKELFSNPDRLNQMSINGQKAIEDKFNTKRLTEEMISIYKKLIQT